METRRAIPDPSQCQLAETTVMRKGTDGAEESGVQFEIIEGNDGPIFPVFIQGGQRLIKREYYQSETGKEHLALFNFDNGVACEPKKEHLHLMNPPEKNPRVELYGITKLSKDQDFIDGIVLDKMKYKERKQRGDKRRAALDKLHEDHIILKEKLNENEVFNILWDLADNEYGRIYWGRGIKEYLPGRNQPNLHQTRAIVAAIFYKNGLKHYIPILYAIPDLQLSYWLHVFLWRFALKLDDVYKKMRKDEDGALSDDESTVVPAARPREPALQSNHDNSTSGDQPPDGGDDNSQREAEEDDDLEAPEPMGEEAAVHPGNDGEGNDENPELPLQENINGALVGGPSPIGGGGSGGSGNGGSMGVHLDLDDNYSADDECSDEESEDDEENNSDSESDNGSANQPDGNGDDADDTEAPGVANEPTGSNAPDPESDGSTDDEDEEQDHTESDRSTDDHSGDQPSHGGGDDKDNEDEEQDHTVASALGATKPTPKEQPGKKRNALVAKFVPIRWVDSSTDEHPGKDGDDEDEKEAAPVNNPQAIQEIDMDDVSGIEDCQIVEPRVEPSHVTIPMERPSKKRKAQVSKFVPIRWADSSTDEDIPWSSKRSRGKAKAIQQTESYRALLRKKKKTRNYSCLYTDSEDDPDNASEDDPDNASPPPEKKNNRTPTAKRPRTTDSNYGPTQHYYLSKSPVTAPPSGYPKITPGEDRAIREGARKLGRGRWKLVQSQAKGKLDRLSPYQIKLAYQKIHLENVLRKAKAEKAKEKAKAKAGRRN